MMGIQYTLATQMTTAGRTAEDSTARLSSFLCLLSFTVFAISLPLLPYFPSSPHLSLQLAKASFYRIYPGKN